MYILLMDRTITNYRNFIEGFVTGICSVCVAVWATTLVITTIRKRRKALHESWEISTSKQYLSIGTLGLALGIILHKFSDESYILTAVEIALFAIAIVFNTLYLVRLRNSHR